jgi:hypothetical protein
VSSIVGAAQLGSVEAGRPVGIGSVRCRGSEAGGHRGPAKSRPRGQAALGPSGAAKLTAVEATHVEAGACVDNFLKFQHRKTGQ